MTPERGRRSTGPQTPFSRGAVRPRVVIFASGSSASVEVVELPPGTEVGSTIRHRNTGWRIVGERPHSRVLIAAPVEH